MELKTLTVTAIAALAVVYLLKKEKKGSTGTATKGRVALQCEEARYDIYEFIDPT